MFAFPEVAMDSGRAFCPRAGCDTVVTVRAASPAHCPTCRHDFCSLCNQENCFERSTLSSQDAPRPTNNKSMPKIPLSRIKNCETTETPAHKKPIHTSSILVAPGLDGFPHDPTHGRRPWIAIHRTRPPPAARVDLCGCAMRSLLIVPNCSNSSHRTFILPTARHLFARTGKGRALPRPPVRARPCYDRTVRKFTFEQ
ncbi:hypothetical protein EVAR_10393_1 [Eumeta japonica]|uniref:IBR domain-containing protein n=1 Tax=Eumeta variegata TaxID=151549 RepID=A0A4C1UCT0_EUMVA|nr:hypothetical protein EVAR_10393_1 [Eumeta japonica]